MTHWRLSPVLVLTGWGHSGLTRWLWSSEPHVSRVIITQVTCHMSHVTHVSSTQPGHADPPPGPPLPATRWATATYFLGHKIFLRNIFLTYFRISKLSSSSPCSSPKPKPLLLSLFSKVKWDWDWNCINVLCRRSRLKKYFIWKSCLLLLKLSHQNYSARCQEARPHNKWNVHRTLFKFHISLLSLLHLNNLHIFEGTGW